MTSRTQRPATVTAPVAGAALPPCAVPPAGSALAATGAEPAGPCTWTLELPPGLPVLSLNQRLHWAERNRRGKALEKAAWALAKQAKIPRLGHAWIQMEYQPPDRRQRDGDNLAASAKPCIDGIVLAGVTEDDTSWYVTYTGCRIGAVYPKGRIVIHITGVAA